MTYRFLILALVYGLLLAACYAQPTAHFQSVSGDFARSWLGGFLEQNPQRAENKSEDLWSWGRLPLGYTLANGTLVPIPASAIMATNYTVNWLGDNYTDPYAGESLNGNQPVSTLPVYGPNLPLAFSTYDPWA